ncbi:MAG TPA: hypothetical protein VHO94_03265 [Oscillospiraceae bacterium]|nr:hypothetical protein [Oscillospiraceae bacterium]
MAGTNIQGKINQSKSCVFGDQVAGDKINNYNVEITKELHPAVEPIRKYGIAPESSDDQNTILIRKLKDGKFSIQSIDHAIRSKLKYVKFKMEMVKTEEGQAVLLDIQENLVSLIHTKYISQLEEGQSLKTNLKDIADDFSSLVAKYENLITIDEALIEGLLYSATSECAVNWKVDDCESD